jgi:hypothetical protein
MVYILNQESVSACVGVRAKDLRIRFGDFPEKMLTVVAVRLSI